MSGVMVPAWMPAEAKAGVLQVEGQPGLHRETMSQKTQELGM
jgi:hypothetical protein